MKESNELFDLCKEVHKRTRWGDDDLSMPIEPTYTSDYLLQKLPSTIKNELDGGDDYLILYKKNSSWYADYMGQFLRCNADTPLKALLKLTIKLHEEESNVNK